MKTQLKSFLDKGKYVLITDNGTGVLYATTENSDNAAYIVKCVNSHEQLKEIVNDAKLICTTFNEMLSRRQSDAEIIGVLDSLIDLIGVKIEGVSND